MSYLLDALQKSEQERRRHQTPDLNQPPAPGAPIEARRRRRSLWIGLAVMLNLGALTALWVWQRGDGDTGTSAPVPERAATESATPATEAAKPGPSTTDALTPNRAAPDEPEPAAHPAAAANAEINLPLVLNAHIYADERRYREVSINGSFYRIGDRIGELELMDITLSGVILERNGEVIELEVGDRWP